MSKRSYHPSSRSSSLLKINNPNLVSVSTKVMKSKSYLAKLRDKQNKLEKESLPNNYFASEELTEKPSVYSEKSVFKSEMSFEQKPSLLNANHEEILNILRLENPKAELRSSPKIYSSRYPSPSKNSQMTSEKCEEIERELKIQKNKYKKLENQYNELLNKNACLDLCFCDTLSLKAKRGLQRQNVCRQNAAQC